MSYLKQSQDQTKWDVTGWKRLAEINTVHTSKQTMETLMQKYVEIFNGELGTIKTFQAELQVWEKRKVKVFQAQISPIFS